jgi:hypothetical protein
MQRHPASSSRRVPFTNGLRGQSSGSQLKPFQLTGIHLSAHHGGLVSTSEESAVTKFPS